MPLKLENFVIINHKIKNRFFSRKMDWYEPGEDSFTLLDVLKSENIKNKVVVDLGCSTGILSEFLKAENFVLSLDLNLTALLEYQNNSSYSTNLIKMDLLDGINQEKIDIVVFNPPYVSDFDCKILGGGEYGRDVIDKFVNDIDVKCFYLLVIEANKPLEILKNIQLKKYTVSVLKIRKVIGETLIIFKATKI